MAAATPARAAALETLRAIRGGALADHALDAAALQLDARERAWTQELVYGTLRLRARLDHTLATHVTRKLAQLDADILDILRLGAYQLLEMGGVPAYAAVSQAVELAKRTRARSAAGFVNGVLQSLRRAGKHSPFPSFEVDPVAHLSSWGSHPRWLVDRWVTHFGADATRRLVAHNNARPTLYLRAFGDRAKVRAQLADAGITTRAVDSAPHVLELVAGSVAHALAAAPVMVQDPAAGLVSTAAAAAIAPVIDLTAAPGGKALALALDAAPRFVAAADVSLARLRRLRENTARLGRPAPVGCGAVPVGAIVADARMPPFATHSAGMVLLDAPCTGTGTLQRHPDGRWRLAPTDVTSLAALQAQLLDQAAALIAPAGVLVYATCSLEPEENGLQVESFLQRHTNFAVEPVTHVDTRYIAADGTLRVWPHDHAFDGAFAVRLRRRA